MNVKVPDKKETENQNIAEILDEQIDASMNEQTNTEMDIQDLHQYRNETDKMLSSDSSDSESDSSSSSSTSTSTSSKKSSDSNSSSDSDSSDSENNGNRYYPFAENKARCIYYFVLSYFDL